jgi:hypothetical protein
MSVIVRCAFSHQVNNLLTVILAHADSLTAHCTSSPPAQAHLEAILSAAHRLASSAYCHECGLNQEAGDLRPLQAAAHAGD